MAGWNHLKPDDNQPHVRGYRIKYGVLGLRYSFKQFNRMLYANIRFDDSSEAGDGAADMLVRIYTIGIRWDYP